MSFFSKPDVPSAPTLSQKEIDKRASEVAQRVRAARARSVGRSATILGGGDTFDQNKNILKEALGG